jgi:hypothetical protein
MLDLEDFYQCKEFIRENVIIEMNHVLEENDEGWRTMS